MTTLFALRDSISLTDARAILTKLPEQLADGQGAIPLTRHGKPVLAVITWDLFESLVETIEVLSDDELMKKILAAGKTRPWEEVKAELDL